jgi:hypothetical protein
VAFAQLAIAEAQAAQLQAARAEEERAIAQEANRIFERTRTPLERFEAELENLNEFLLRGAIDLETYERAVGLAAEAVDRASGSEEARLAGALEAGSTGAISAVNQFLAGGRGDPQARVVDAIQRLQQNQDRGFQDVVRALREAGFEVLGFGP